MATPLPPPADPPAEISVEPSAPLRAGPFELSGGALCLDFVNTWGDRERPETDQLRGFGDLLAFAVQTGGLDEARYRELAAQAARGSAPESAAAAAAFATALGLRESLFRIFTGRDRGRAVVARDLASLNAVLNEGLAHLRVEAPTASDAAVPPAAPEASAGVRDEGAGRESPGERTAAFTWSFEPVALATAPLWPIARSAADLLTSPDGARVTLCDGSDCTWLFLDRSRTGNRRWCSMQSCGNRAKARRHYHRRKA